MPEDEEIPVKFEGHVGELPDVEAGDEIYVETRASYDTNRTLTVKEVEEEPDYETESLSWSDEKHYVLSGYGTEYRLVKEYSLTKSWKQISLIWPSRPEGIVVESLEVNP